MIESWHDEFIDTKRIGHISEEAFDSIEPLELYIFDNAELAYIVSFDDYFGQISATTSSGHVDDDIALCEEISEDTISINIGNKYILESGFNVDDIKNDIISDLDDTIIYDLDASLNRVHMMLN